MTPPTVAALTRIPMNLNVSCFLGVEPSQYPILRSVIKLPAVESAVQTTPPMIRAAVIPLTPFSPTAAIMTQARISVISVIPLTGLEPTIAIAFAATVVNRNAMIATMRIPTIANSRLPFITPKRKKTKVIMSVTNVPIAIIFMLRSCCVRGRDASLLLLPLNTFPISPKELLMTLQLLAMPITPAMAIAPIPRLFA